MDSPTEVRRTSRMLRKRLDKKKEIRRGEGSASPQRMDYSSDTGSQNSLNLKVSSVPVNMNSILDFKAEKKPHGVRYCPSASITTVVSCSSLRENRTYQSKRKMPPHIKALQMPVTLRRKSTVEKVPEKQILSTTISPAVTTSTKSRRPVTAARHLGEEYFDPSVDPPKQQRNPSSKTDSPSQIGSGESIKPKADNSPTSPIKPTSLKPIVRTYSSRRLRKNLDCEIVKPPPSELKPPQSEPKTPQSESKTPQSEPKTPQSELKPPQSELKPPQSELKPPQSELKPLQSEPKPLQSEPKPPQSEPKPQQSEPKLDQSLGSQVIVTEKAKRGVDKPQELQPNKRILPDSGDDLNTSTSKRSRLNNTVSDRLIVSIVKLQESEKPPVSESDQSQSETSSVSDVTEKSSGTDQAKPSLSVKKPLKTYVRGPDGKIREKNKIQAMTDSPKSPQKKPGANKSTSDTGRSDDTPSVSPANHNKDSQEKELPVGTRESLRRKNAEQSLKSKAAVKKKRSTSQKPVLRARKNKTRLTGESSAVTTDDPTADNVKSNAEVGTAPGKARKVKRDKTNKSLNPLKKQYDNKPRVDDDLQKTDTKAISKPRLQSIQPKPKPSPAVKNTDQYEDPDDICPFFNPENNLKKKESSVTLNETSLMNCMTGFADDVREKSPNPQLIEEAPSPEFLKNHLQSETSGKSCPFIDPEGETSTIQSKRHQITSIFDQDLDDAHVTKPAKLDSDEMDNLDDIIDLTADSDEGDHSRLHESSDSDVFLPKPEPSDSKNKNKILSKKSPVDKGKDGEESSCDVATSSENAHAAIVRTSKESHVTVSSKKTEDMVDSGHHKDDFTQIQSSVVNAQQTSVVTPVPATPSTDVGAETSGVAAPTSETPATEDSAEPASVATPVSGTTATDESAEAVKDATPVPATPTTDKSAEPASVVVTPESETPATKEHAKPSNVATSTPVTQATKKIPNPASVTVPVSETQSTDETAEPASVTTHESDTPATEESAKPASAATLVSETTSTEESAEPASLATPVSETQAAEESAEPASVTIGILVTPATEEKADPAGVAVPVSETQATDETAEPASLATPESETQSSEESATQATNISANPASVAVPVSENPATDESAEPASVATPESDAQASEESATQATNVSANPASVAVPVSENPATDESAEPASVATPESEAQASEESATQATNVSANPASVAVPVSENPATDESVEPASVATPVLKTPTNKGRDESASLAIHVSEIPATEETAEPAGVATPLSQTPATWESAEPASVATPESETPATEESAEPASVATPLSETPATEESSEHISGATPVSEMPINEGSAESARMDIHVAETTTEESTEPASVATPISETSATERSAETASFATPIPATPTTENNAEPASVATPVPDTPAVEQEKPTIKESSQKASHENLKCPMDSEKDKIASIVPVRIPQACEPVTQVSEANKNDHHTTDKPKDQVQSEISQKVLTRKIQSRLVSRPNFSSAVTEKLDTTRSHVIVQPKVKRSDKYAKGPVNTKIDGKKLIEQTKPKEHSGLNKGLNEHLSKEEGLRGGPVLEQPVKQDNIVAHFIGDQSMPGLPFPSVTSSDCVTSPKSHPDLNFAEVTSEYEEVNRLPSLAIINNAVSSAVTDCETLGMNRVENSATATLCLESHDVSQAVEEVGADVLEPPSSVRAECNTFDLESESHAKTDTKVESLKQDIDASSNVDKSENKEETGDKTVTHSPVPTLATLAQTAAPQHVILSKNELPADEHKTRNHQISSGNTDTTIIGNDITSGASISDTTDKENSIESKSSNTKQKINAPIETDDEVGSKLSLECTVSAEGAAPINNLYGHPVSTVSSDNIIQTESSIEQRVPNDTVASHSASHPEGHWNTQNGSVELAVTNESSPPEKEANNDTEAIQSLDQKRDSLEANLDSTDLTSNNPEDGAFNAVIQLGEESSVANQPNNILEANNPDDPQAEEADKIHAMDNSAKTATCLSTDQDVEDQRVNETEINRADDPLEDGQGQTDNYVKDPETPISQQNGAETNDQLERETMPDLSKDRKSSLSDLYIDKTAVNSDGQRKAKEAKTDHSIEKLLSYGSQCNINADMSGMDDQVEGEPVADLSKDLERSVGDQQISVTETNPSDEPLKDGEAKTDNSIEILENSGGPQNVDALEKCNETLPDPVHNSVNKEEVSIGLQHNTDLIANKTSVQQEADLDELTGKDQEIRGVQHDTEADSDDVEGEEAFVDTTAISEGNLEARHQNDNEAVSIPNHDCLEEKVEPVHDKADAITVHQESTGGDYHIYDNEECKVEEQQEHVDMTVDATDKSENGFKVPDEQENNNAVKIGDNLDRNESTSPDLDNSVDVDETSGGLQDKKHTEASKTDYQREDRVGIPVNPTIISTKSAEGCSEMIDAHGTVSNNQDQEPIVEVQPDIADTQAFHDRRSEICTDESDPASSFPLPENADVPVTLTNKTLIPNRDTAQSESMVPVPISDGAVISKTARTEELANAKLLLDIASASQHAGNYGYEMVIGDKNTSNVTANKLSQPSDESFESTNEYAISLGYDDDDDDGDIWPSLSSSPSLSDHSDNDEEFTATLSLPNSQVCNAEEPRNIPLSNEGISPTDEDTLRQQTSDTSIEKMPVATADIHVSNDLDLASRKSVTEVCACDTTTGSTDDEHRSTLSTERASPESVDQEPPTEPEDLVKNVHQGSGRLGRREWGKELTKIRIKLNEKKKQRTQDRIQKALQSRKKSLSARQAKRAMILAASQESPAKTRSEETSLVVKQTQSHVTMEHPSELGPKAKEVSNVVEKLIHATIPASEASTSSVLTAYEIHKLSKSFDSAEEKARNALLPALTFDNIEIVDDDDDDDEPWPFEASPVDSESDQSRDAPQAVTEAATKIPPKPTSPPEPTRVQSMPPIVTAIIGNYTGSPLAPAGAKLIHPSLTAPKPTRNKKGKGKLNRKMLSHKPLQKILPKTPVMFSDGDNDIIIAHASPTPAAADTKRKKSKSPTGTAKKSHRSSKNTAMKSPSSLHSPVHLKSPSGLPSPASMKSPQSYLSTSAVNPPDLRNQTSTSMKSPKSFLGPSAVFPLDLGNKTPVGMKSPTNILSPSAVNPLDLGNKTPASKESPQSILSPSDFNPLDMRNKTPTMTSASPASANYSVLVPLKLSASHSTPAANLSFLEERGGESVQAKMKRSSERCQEHVDSQWKDMFSSEVVPLDFDEPAFKKQKTFDHSMSKVLEASAQFVKGTVSTARKIPLAYQNTPCGDSYPIREEIAVKPMTADNFILCSCKLKGVFSPNKDRLKIMFCQAVDTVGNSIINCMSKVIEKNEVRASANLPHLVLCKYHMKKLANHTSCPVCGLFCSGGEFMDCLSGKGHLHHKSCQVKAKDGSYLCPHCGEKSMQVKTYQTYKHKAEKQRSTNKSTGKKDGSGEGIARMCIRLVSKPSTSQTELLSSSFDNKLFEVSKSKLLDGAEKTKLINVMSSLEHLVPLMKEKLEGAGSSTSWPSTLYNLSSYILKNDLSQLVIAICDVIRRSKNAQSKGKFPLDFQFTEQGGKTLLHLAIQSSSLATVHCLVMAGAALNSTDNKGVTTLMMAAKGNHLDILKYLIGAGASVELRDVDGMSALHMASVAGNRAICEYLLSDVHVDSNCMDEGGWTPLVWAIENGHSNVVKLLISAGADVHMRDAEGNVSIHWGAYSGNTEIIKLLIGRGADIESVNELGDRPLHIAVRQARTDAAILLLSFGADTSAINNLHETAAECCHGACSENMKSFLTVNNMLRSCKIAGVQTRSSKLLHQDIARGKERLPIPVTNDVDNTNYPTDFVYVTESVWTSPVPINTTISSLQSCNCQGDCTRAACPCVRSSIQCWYGHAGVLCPEFDFINPPQLFECNRACGCWNTCSNRVVQQGITAQLELFKTKHRGWGVKARHDIVMGQFVCEYVGELITDEEADEREDDSYLFDLDYKDGDTYCMDAKHYGNISRFINHRCEPNLTPVSVFMDHQDIRFPRICLFANTDIPQGTELGFDYGEKFWLVKYKDFLCDCGCASCKYNKDTINATLAANQTSPLRITTTKDSLPASS